MYVYVFVCEYVYGVVYVLWHEGRTPGVRSCWRTAPTKSWSEGEGAGIVLPSVFTSIVIPGREFTEGFPMAKVTKVDEKASDEEVAVPVIMRAGCIN